MENWEQDRTKNDWQRYYWDESPSRTRLLNILKSSNVFSFVNIYIYLNVILYFQKDPSSLIVERYRKSITRVQDEGIENELKNLKDYKNDVLMLYNLKL